MTAADAPSKPTLRGNFSVSLSLEEARAIDDAAHELRVSRAQFIREAAIERAKRLGHQAAA